MTIFNKVIVGVILAVLSLTTSAVAFWGMADDKDKRPAYVMTQSDLQSSLMGFADRFVSVLASRVAEIDALSRDEQNRQKILSLCVYTMHSAYTIAADPRPAVALLDMAAMITLGRMILEQADLNQIPEVEPVLKAFQAAEPEIFQITGKLLNETQQKRLLEFTADFRREHPEVTFFPYVRFADFEAVQKSARLAKGEKPEGLFKSVEAATQKVEEMRLLAERGIYLGTRLPMLTGLFADVWLSRLGHNPQYKKVTDQLVKLNEVSERFAKVAESLPAEIAEERDRTIKQAMQNISQLTLKTIDATAKKVAFERKATIRQIMQGISAERKQTFDDFAAQEQRLQGVLTDLRLALVEGNNLVTSVNSLSQRLGLDATSGRADSKAEPVSIDDYRKTIADATQLVNQLNSLTETVDHLLRSSAWETLQPLLERSVDRVGAEGEQIIDHTFRQVVLLMLIGVIAYVVARLLYQYLSKKI